MIFEIHLFEKQHEWMRPKERKLFLKDKSKDIGKEVVAGWNDTSGKLRWQSLPGWFRIS